MNRAFLIRSASLTAVLFAGLAANASAADLSDDELRERSKQLRAKDLKKVRTAARALAASKDARAFAPLLNLLKHRRADRALVAIEALGELGDLRALGPLAGSTLSAHYPTLRDAAARSLGRLDGKAAGEKLRDYLKKPRRSRPIDRQHLGPPLGVLGGAAARDALDILAKDSDETVRQGAVIGFGRLAEGGEMLGVDRIIAMLRDPSAEVRTLAHMELMRLTGKKVPLDRVRWEDWWAAQKKKLPETGSASDPGAGGAALDKDGVLNIAQKEIDIVFVFDATGSLGRKWPTVSGPILNLILNMVNRQARIRVGSVEFRAERTALAVKRRALSYDAAAAQKYISRIHFGGGSGGLKEGLLSAIRDFQWRESAYRSVVIVGDLGPRPEDLAPSLLLARSIRQLEGIPVSAIFIETAHGPGGRPIFARIAREGGGRFYEFDFGEAVLRDKTPGAPKAPKEGERTDTLADKLLSITQTAVKP